MRTELSILVFDYEDGRVGVQSVEKHADGQDIYENCQQTTDKDKKARLTLLNLTYSDKGVVVNALSKEINKHEKKSSKT